MGNIIAVVAVLLIHIEKKALMAPQEMMIRVGLRATSAQDNMVRARRLSNLWTIMASASRKLPMKRKMMGLEKGAKAVLASAIPRMTQRATPSKAVTGMGIASVTQYISTRARMAVRRWATVGREGKGHRSKRRNNKGPKKNPAVLRQRSSLSSAAEMVRTYPLSSFPLLGPPASKKCLSLFD